MLESNPTVLSPSVPQIMEYYGLWGEPESYPPPIKIEAADIIDIMGPTSSTTIHHLGRQLSHNNLVNMNQNSQYSPISTHPSGEPSYQSPEAGSHTCQNFDYFSPDPLTTSYTKFSDVQAPAPFIENFDYFLPDVSQPHGSLVFTGGHSAMQYQFGDQNTSHSGPSSQSHIPLPHSEYPYWDELHCDQDYVTSNKQECCFSAVSDLDSEELDSKSSAELHSNSTESSFHAPQKRKVGRPPKKDKKQKQHEKKTGRLWEFIRDLLKNPEYCPSLVKWENAEEGLFRFVNSEKVAQLWGQIKGNPRMTYEKLSRAMRYYYKSHVFEPVLGRRLVYKFGVNATNWRPVNNYMSGVKVYGNTSGRNDIRTNSSISHSFFFQEQD